MLGWALLLPFYVCYSLGMEKEYVVEITGPHTLGTVRTEPMTYAQAQALAKSMESNRHARTVEIKRAS